MIASFPAMATGQSVCTLHIQLVLWAILSSIALLAFPILVAEGRGRRQLGRKCVRAPADEVGRCEPAGSDAWNQLDSIVRKCCARAKSVRNRRIRRQ